MNEEQAQKMAGRIVDKAMPAWRGALEKIAAEYGLAPQELWEAKCAQVALEDREGCAFDFALVARAYAQLKREGRWKD